MNVENVAWICLPENSARPNYLAMGDMIMWNICNFSVKDPTCIFTVSY